MTSHDTLDSIETREGALGSKIVIGSAVCCLMVGVIFRAMAAGDCLWLDEQHTAWAAKSGLADVAGRAADGNQTPLYFYCCWAAVQCGGESALSVRLPSLLCGLALMTIVSLAIYRRTQSAASLLVVSAFLLLDYDSVFYASEARPYVMVQLLGVIQAAVFYNWISASLSNEMVQRSRTYLWGVAAAVLAAMIFYTHPTGMLLIVAEVVFLGGLVLMRRKLPWRSLIAAAMLGAVLVLPGVVMISFIWQRRENWTSVTDPQQVFSALAIQTLVLMAWPILILVFDSCITFRDNRLWPSERRRFIFIACWALIPSLTIVALDFAGWLPLAIGRYAIVGAVAFPIFASLMIGEVRNNLLRAVAALAIVGWLAWFSQTAGQVKDGGLRHENWKRVVEIINAEDESLPVFLVANLIEDKWAESDQSDGFQRYLGFPLRGIPTVTAPQRIVPRPSQGEILSAENLALIAESGGGLVVVRDLEVYRDAIRLEIIAALQENPLTMSAELYAAPIDFPRPNNVHLFLIKSGRN